MTQRSEQDETDPAQIIAEYRLTAKQCDDYAMHSSGDERASWEGLARRLRELASAIEKFDADE